MAYYADIDALRGYLNQVDVGEPADTLLNDCLRRASGMVRDALRVAIGDLNFDYVPYTAATARTVMAYGGTYLTLPPHKPGSITSVSAGGSVVSSTTYTETPQGALMWLTEVWGGRYEWHGGSYVVTASWGYGPEVPDAIEELTLELAVNLWRSKDKGGFTEMVGVEGGGAIRQIAGLNKQQEAVIANVAAQLREVVV